MITPPDPPRPGTPPPSPPPSGWLPPGPPPAYQVPPGPTPGSIYAQQMSPPHGQYVTQGGISPTGHTVHAVLTVVTCGAWGLVWFVHWLATRTRRTTTY